MSWPKTADGLWYIFEGQVLMPVDPGTGVPILMLRPQGGMGVGIPAIESGDDGVSPTIQSGVILTELASSDPTAASASFTLVSPGPPPIYALTAALHAGAPGAPGTTSISLASIGGTAVSGKIIKVNSGVTGFDYAYEKVGERYIPASVNNTSAGNANSTLAIVSIPAKNFDYRPRVRGYSIITQNGGANVVVDLVARLGGTGGNIIGDCLGIGGTERLTLSAGPIAGSVDAFDKVTAGNATSIYLRTEQRSGSDSYTTSASTTRFSVEVLPIS